MTAVNVDGLIDGAERSARPAQRLLELDTLLAGVTVLPYDEQAARHFGSLKVALERRGERLDDADLHIAAIALSRSVVLVTHNSRHFDRVPGLPLEDWLT